MEEQQNKKPSESDIKNTPCQQELALVENSHIPQEALVAAFSAEWHGRSQNFVVYVCCRINGELYDFDVNSNGKAASFMDRVVKKVDEVRIHEDGYLLDENSIVIHQNADKSMVIENVQVKYKTSATYGRQVGLFSKALTKKTMEHLMGIWWAGETLFTT